MLYRPCSWTLHKGYYYRHHSAFYEWHHMVGYTEFTRPSIAVSNTDHIAHVGQSQHLSQQNIVLELHVGRDSHHVMQRAANVHSQVAASHIRRFVHHSAQCVRNPAE